MVEVQKAWQCIGCGRIEGQQTCIGVCEDRPVNFVYAFEYEEAVERIARLEAFVRQVANATPREGAWEASYRALRERARKFVVTGNVPVPIQK